MKSVSNFRILYWLFACPQHYSGLLTGHARSAVICHNHGNSTFIAPNITVARILFVTSDVDRYNAFEILERLLPCPIWAPSGGIYRKTESASIRECEHINLRSAEVINVGRDA